MRELTNQLFDISKSESLPPANPADIKQKFHEKQKLEEER